MFKEPLACLLNIKWLFMQPGMASTSLLNMLLFSEILADTYNRLILQKFNKII